MLVTMVGSAHSQAARRQLRLSGREEEIVKLASEGCTDTAIAHRLGISEATVGTYWGRVRIKLGPYSRTELVSLYLKETQHKELDDLRSQNSQLTEKLQELTFVEKDEHCVYRDIMEFAPDAMFVISELGVVIGANQAAHEMLGYDAGKLAGMPLGKFIPAPLHEVHKAHRMAYLTAPTKRSMGTDRLTPILCKDGHELPVRINLSAIETPMGYVAICTLRTIEA